MATKKPAQSPVSVHAETGRLASGRGAMRHWLVLQGDQAHVVESGTAPDLSVDRGQRRKKVMGVYTTAADAQECAAAINSRSRLPIEGGVA